MARKKKTDKYVDADTIIDHDMKLLPPVASKAKLPTSARPNQYCLVEDEDAFYQFVDNAWIEADEDAM